MRFLAFGNDRVAGKDIDDLRYRSDDYRDIYKYVRTQLIHNQRRYWCIYDTQTGRLHRWMVGGSVPVRYWYDEQGRVTFKRAESHDNYDPYHPRRTQGSGPLLAVNSSHP